MTWDTRLRDAAYTAPGGDRLTFIYEDFAEHATRKTSAYTFADVDGTYIQDLGNAGRRYPIRIITAGPTHDTEADAWMAALSERGEGRLEHPRFGLKVVVPTGTIKRREDPLREGGQTTIEVEFFETLGTAYPTTIPDAASNATAIIEDAADTQAEALDAAGVLGSAAKRSEFLAEFNRNLDVIRDTLAEVAEPIDEVRRQFSAIDQAINRGIDVIIRDPLTLAYQVQQLIRTPARILGTAKARVEAYANLTRQLINGTPTTRATLAARDTTITATITATFEAANNTEYSRRIDAIEAAETIIVLIEDVGEFRSAAYTQVGAVDSGRVWQEVQALGAVVAGKLVGASFELATKEIYTTSSARTIIDLAYEIYGDVDGALDQIIDDNNLPGGYIVEIPRGSNIIYYKGA